MSSLKKYSVRKSYHAQNERYNDERHGNHKESAPGDTEELLRTLPLRFVFAYEAHSVWVVFLLQFFNLGLMLSTELALAPQVKGHDLKSALELKLVVTSGHKA